MCEIYNMEAKMNRTENLQDYREFLNKIYFDILERTDDNVIKLAGFKNEEVVKGITEDDWMEAYNFIYVPMGKIRKMSSKLQSSDKSLKDDLVFLNRKMKLVREGISHILTKELHITIAWENTKTGKCEFIV